MIKVVLVGCGYWGKNWYKTLTLMDNVKIVAVIDPNPSIPVLNQVNNLADFDAKSYDYTHVIIAAQAEYHKSYVKYFKEKIGGDNVLVEKPCGLLNEPRELYYNCYPGYIFLSTPHYKRIKNMVYEKQLGKILYSKFTRASMGPRIRTDVSIIEDYMIHDLYIYLDLFQPKQKDLTVNKTMNSYLGNHIKPDTAEIEIIHNDHKATFFSSWIYPEKERKIVIVGTEGSLIWNGEKLYFTRSHYSPIQGQDKYGNWNWDLREHPTVDITPAETRSALELEFIDFVEQVPRTQVQKDLDKLLNKLVN